MLLTGDFETIVDPDDCRVWSWGISDINDHTFFEWGTDIDSFMLYLRKTCKYEVTTIYFHNLKFDGEFILYWLFQNGFEYVENKKELKTGTFCTLISDMGQWYSIEICFKRQGKKIQKIKILDSLKILNMSVEQVGKAFCKNHKKLVGTIDYKMKRPVGYQPTDIELAYQREDVQVMAEALHLILIVNKMNKMTIGSDALADYKNSINKKQFSSWFPKLDDEVDRFIRNSYKGGYVYANPKYSNKDIGEGIVLDVNSLYPSRMYNEKLPYGVPIYFTGDPYKAITKQYDLFVIRFECAFELKKNHLPTVQIKNNFSHYIPTEYIESSDGAIEVLTMTSVDFELFKDHYDIYNLEFIDGYKFKSQIGMFKNYIDKHMADKVKYKAEGNKGQTQIAKLFLNSLYGKFALKPVVKGKYPVYDEVNNKISYKLTEPENRGGIYIPVGTFITAYARNLTIRAAQKCYDRFLYADTDSLHLIGKEYPEGLEIDPLKLGAWDHELTFFRSRYIRSKCYIEDTNNPLLYETELKWNSSLIEDEKERKKLKEERKNWYDYADLKITCAGMPKACYINVTYENFVKGSSFDGKLQFKHVPNGICPIDGEFTIKF